jgi:membrane protease YdiL (CAAX protease family)
MTDDSPATASDGRSERERSPTRDLASGLAAVLAIVGATVRQEYHRRTATRRKRALLLLGTVAFFPVVGLLLLGAFRAGSAAAAADSTALLDLARWVFPGVFVLVVANGALLVTDELLEFWARRLLLSTVPDRTLVLALLAGVLGRTAAVGAVPLTLLFAAFALGAGSAVAGGAAWLATVVTLLSGVLVGVSCGLAGRALLYRAPLSADTRELYGTVGRMGFFVLLGAVGAAAGAVLGRSGVESTGFDALAPESPPPVPLGYAADWLFLGTSLVGDLDVAAWASGALIVACVPLSVGAIVRLAPRLWYTEPARPDGATSTEPSRSFLDGGWGAGRLGIVVDGLVRRTVRQPQRLAFLAYHLFVPVVLGAGLLIGGDLASMVVGGGCLVLVGLWLAGAVFCLNPLGNEGAMIGPLVRSPTPAATLLRARLLAGSLLGVPPVLVGAVLVGIGAETLGLVATVALGAYWLTLVPASAGMALGIGALLPATETRELLEVIEVRAPEALAIVAHAVGVAILAVGGLALTAIRPEPAALISGAVVLVVATLAAGHGGYRFAVLGLADHSRQRRPDRAFAVELGLGTGLLGLMLSETASLGVATIVGVDGFAGSVSVFLGGYVGMAAVVVGYLLLADRRDYLDISIPTRAHLRMVILVTSGLLAAWLAVTAGARMLGLPFAEHALGGTASGPGQLAVIIALVLLVNAPVEEALFRNVIQKRLSEALSRRDAIVVATLAFGLVHVPVYAGAGATAAVLPLALVTVAGAGFAVVYDRTANLSAAALCHGLYNAVQLVVAAV